MAMAVTESLVVIWRQTGEEKDRDDDNSNGNDKDEDRDKDTDTYKDK